MQGFLQIRRWQHVVFIACTIMFCNGLHAKAALQQSITLEQALETALNNNPELAAALHTRDAAEGAKVQASTRLNPTLSAEIQDTKRDYRESSLAISQEIELGNKRSMRMKAARLNVDKASASITQKQANIHADVVSAFYTVLANQESLTLSQEMLKVAKLSLNAATKRVQAGKISPVEETKSRIAQSTAKIEVNHAKNQLNKSKRHLSTLLGVASINFEYAIGALHAIPVTPNLAELLSLLEKAPQTQVSQLEVSALEAMTSVERSKATPNITVSAGFVNNQELGGRNQALLGLSIPIPVFNQNIGNIQEAINQKYQAEDKLLALKNKQTTAITTQVNRLKAAKETASSLNSEILPDAKSAFNAANKGFSAGKFNFLDVLDAQRTLFHAQSQHIRALLEAHQSIAEIERILGSVITHPTSNPEE